MYIDIAKEKFIRGQENGKYTVPIFDMLSAEAPPMPLIEQLCDKLTCLRPRDFAFANNTEQYQTLLSDIKASIKEFTGKCGFSERIRNESVYHQKEAELKNSGKK